MFTKPFFVISFCLIFIYSLPRYLTYAFSPENPWTSFLYTYSLGGLIFFVGIYIILKFQACNFKISSDRKWFYSMFLGFIYLMSLHAFWIYFSIQNPNTF